MWNNFILKKLDKTSSTDRASGSGRPHSRHTCKNTQAVYLLNLGRPGKRAAKRVYVFFIEWLH